MFVRRGLLPGDDAQAMAQWAHGGVSVDASVRIAAADRASRERLLRFCARPPFALDRLHELDPEHLLYDSAKPGPGGNGPQLPTPLQLLDRLASLVPPPRVHRHRYFGGLAPNAPLRAAVTTLAPAASTAPPAPIAEPAAAPAHRRAARYTWAPVRAANSLTLPQHPPRRSPSPAAPAHHSGFPSARPDRGRVTPAPTSLRCVGLPILWQPRPSTVHCVRRRVGACPQPPARVASSSTLANHPPGLPGPSDGGTSRRPTVPRSTRRDIGLTIPQMFPDDKGTHYIPEVVASECPGLLARIACVPANANVSVVSAKIDTLGERAEDGFLIDGSRLHEQALLKLETVFHAQLRIQPKRCRTSRARNA